MISLYEFNIKLLIIIVLYLVTWIMTVRVIHSTNCSSRTASKTITALCIWFPLLFSIFTLNIQNERQKCFHLHVVNLWRIEQFTDISSITSSNWIVCKNYITIKPRRQNATYYKTRNHYWNWISCIVQSVITMTQLLSTITFISNPRC